ncbi:MAG: hypothetical protein FK734_01155 [Asgard group archaeon]|nr:hypothetical protein [Asgard group archaeon]
MDDVHSLAKLIRFTEDKIICTGGVVFVGEGNTGKTHTAMNITSSRVGSYYGHDDELKKSVNLELDYFIFQSNIEEYQLRTSSQIFIMPGQKGRRSSPGEGLAFEDAVDLYFNIASIKVVLTLVLTYDLTDIKTFQELEYWLDRAIERDIIHNYTSIIILGTHLEQEDNIEVMDETIDFAREFVRDYILQKQGTEISLDNIHTIKVSNITLEGIEELKTAINHSFLAAFRIFDLVNHLKQY